MVGRGRAPVRLGPGQGQAACSLQERREMSEEQEEDSWENLVEVCQRDEEDLMLEEAVAKDVLAFEN